MHKLLYVSSTRREFPQDDLREILAASRANNALLGVTGLLLYIDGGFLQVLEGERDTLRSLYARIAQDKRHWDAKLLFDEEASRNFGAWSMGFKALDAAADAGVVAITQDAIKGLIQPGNAKPIVDVLIRTFQTVQSGAG